MHKLFLSMALILSASICHANPQLDQVFQKLKAGQPQTVVVYGTSLTAGGMWAKAMKEWFDKEYPNQVTFVNSGKGGANSDAGVRLLAPKVLALKPDLVFIEYSYNDSVDDLMPVQQGWDNLDKMVTGILTQNPQTAIVLQTMNVGWDPSPEKLPFSRRANLEKYNDNYRRYAREKSLPLIDHYQSWVKLKEEDPAKFHAYLPDGSHPSPAASLAVTWPALEAFLNQARQSPQTSP